MTADAGRRKMMWWLAAVGAPALVVGYQTLGSSVARLSSTTGVERIAHLGVL